MISPYRSPPPGAPRRASGALARVTMLLALLGPSVGVVVGGCSAATGGGGGPNVIAPGIDFAICVLTNGAADVAKQMTPVEVTADLLAKCGGNLVAIANVLDADARAHESGASAKAFGDVARAARARAASSGDGG
jgi:hypothetical protein